MRFLQDIYELANSFVEAFLDDDEDEADDDDAQPSVAPRTNRLPAAVEKGKWQYQNEPHWFTLNVVKEVLFVCLLKYSLNSLKVG